jgi:hypothetical protein
LGHAVQKGDNGILNGFLIVVCFLVFAEGLSWITASGPGQCLVPKVTRENAPSGHDTTECATFLSGMTILAGRGADFIRRDDNDKVIVAAFTVILAVSTIGLWLATNALQCSTQRLWDAGERQLKHFEFTAQRELRAYVYLEKTKPKLTVDGVWEISFWIKNFGQTPAHDVRLFSVARVVDWNDGNPQIPTPDSIETVGSLAPRGDFLEFAPALQGEATLAELQVGTRAIYLVGNIIYDTTFAMGRCETNFRYYIGGDVIRDLDRVLHEDGEELSAASIGNDAT